VLSNERARSSVDYLVRKGVAKDRISAKGYGRSCLLITGEDLSEEEHQENRRVTIKFKLSGNDAQAMVYETIAPSKSKKARKDITLLIDGLDSTAHCFKKGTHLEHTTGVEITANTEEGQEKTNAVGTSPITHRVVARAPYFRLAPLELLIPSKAPINQYLYKVNTCRYYSEKDNDSIVVQVYPDVKWNFHLFLNLSKPLAVSWSGLDTPGRKAMLSTNAHLINQKKYEYTEAAIGGALTAHWNKMSENKYEHSFDVSAQWEDKFKWLHRFTKRLKNLDNGITKQTRGTASNYTGGLPVRAEMLSPKISIGAEWQLARGEKANVILSSLGTQVKIYVIANPLIGLQIKIDLLDAAIRAGSVAVTGNTVAADLFEYSRKWAEKGYESDRFLLNFTMALDVIIQGVITGDGSITWNTNSDVVEGAFKPSAKIGVKLEAKLELNAKAIIVKIGKDVGKASKQEGVGFEGKGKLSVDSGEIF
jgi:hypothetical protein